MIIMWTLLFLLEVEVTFLSKYTKMVINGFNKTNF